MSVTNGSQIGVDTGKVVSIAQQMIEINNRQVGDFSAVEEALKRLGAEWSEPSDVATAAFKCFDQIKTKYFDPTVAERRELAQFLCDAVGIGYENTENQNKKVLEGLFDVGETAPSIDKSNQEVSNNTISNTTSTNVEEVNNRLDSVEMICNKFVDANKDNVDDGDFIFSGCVLTTVVNLMRRKQAVNNEPITITKEDVINLGYAKWENRLDSEFYRGKSAYTALNMQWGDYGSQGLCEQLGFDMESKTANITEELLIEKLNSHPEGILLYSKGKQDHAILVTEYKNGDFYVVDPNDGGTPVKFSECDACASEWGSFKNYSFQQILGNAYRISWLN